MKRSVAHLLLKVVPGASSEGVAGWLEGSLRVRVRAPAERGKANAAVEKIVAEALGVSKRSVRIKSGMTSVRKTVEVDGLSIDEIRLRLSKETD